MTYYTGDIVGEFVWSCQENGTSCRHVLDPLFLEKYGGVLEETCQWEGCHCYVQENNLPYCMQCYNSIEEHNAVANSNDLRVSRLSHDMSITRASFNARVRPWLEEFQPIAIEDVKELTFLIHADSVHYDEWELSDKMLNVNIIQEYCFLKQIEYYFDHMDSSICWFHIHE